MVEHRLLIPSALLLLALLPPATLASPTFQPLPDGSLFNHTFALEQVKKLCDNQNFLCPSSIYRIQSGQLISFDDNKILSSKVFDDFRAGRLGLDESQVIPILRNEFCCHTGPCLAECGIVLNGERALIDRFPEVSEEIFELGFPELSEYKKYWIAHQKNLQKDANYGTPAEIGELYDLLHVNEAKYLKALAAKQAENKNL